MRSISGQLAILYSVTSLILLIIVLTSSYLVMSAVLRAADYQFLSDEIDVLQYLLQSKPNDLQALQQEITDIPHALQKYAYRYYVRILDNQHRIVMETADAKAIFQESPLVKSTSVHTNPFEQWWTSPQGQHYLLMASPVTFGHPAKQWFIQTALDVSYHKKTIITYHKILLMISLFAAFLALCFSVIIARKAVKRLHELTKTTEKITASSLHQRIAPKNWPVELHALAIAFNCMLSRIEDAFTRLTQLSADLAHELRTPIHNLIGEVEVLLSRQHSLEEYRRVSESILEELHRLGHLLEDLLFLSRAENPQLEIQKEYLSVDQEIAVIIEYYRALAEEKNIALICQGSASLFANQTMFRRLISNIIANALKYTPTNGRIFCDIQETDQSIQITIQDNGIGIAGDHLPKLFQRFYRVDAARSHDSGGYGLGLAIAKSIMDMHHGQISIASTLQQGTEIQIIFPK